MTYVAAQDSLDGIAKVIYESKDGKRSKKFEALEWLAQLTTHIPNKGESAGGGSDIMAIILISHVDYGKKPVPMIKSLH